MNCRSLRAVVVSMLFLGLTTSIAGATLIDGLSFEHYPRVYSMDIEVIYDADGGTNGTGLLTASGWSWDCYDESPASSYVLWGDFTLAVEIDKTTLEAVSGTLLVNDPGGPVDVLFASDTITDFGFGGNDLLQFMFVQEGTGMLAPDNEPVGVIINGVSIPDTLFSEGNQPTFQEDFSNSNSANGYSDAFYLPEPATMLLLATGLGGICIRRRKK